jgi:tetratricopeptide (TPR) repeat protein
MTTTADDQPGTGPPARRRRRRGWALAGLLAAAAAAALAWWFWHRRGGPEPVVPDLTDADPAVAAAVEEARREVVNNPRVADAWGRLGMVLLANGFFTEADPALARAEQLDPRDPRWPYLRGMVLRRGNPDEAIPHLRRAADLAREHTGPVQLRLAETLLEQGRSGEADALFRRLVEDHPDNPRVHLGLARLAFERGDFPESLRHLQRCAGNPYARKAAAALRAEVYQRQGDPRAAREARRAVDLSADPDWPDPVLDEALALQAGRKALLDRATQLLGQRRTAEGLALFRQAVRDYPKSEKAWLSLGWALLEVGDVTRAVEALQRALDLKADLAEGHFYLGIARARQGELHGAADAFRKAAVARPGYAVASYNLGQCLKGVGDRRGALDAFRSAVRHRPNYPEAHAGLAGLLIQEGRPAEALVHLDHALDLGPPVAGPDPLGPLAGVLLSAARW